MPEGGVIIMAGEQWGVEREKMIVMRQLKNLVFITFLNNSPPVSAEDR